MSIKKITVTTSLILALVSCLSSTIASAESAQKPGKRRGPPPEAIEACADKAEAASCSFSGREGEVTGSCVVPPKHQNELVCAPQGGPPEGQANN